MRRIFTETLHINTKLIAPKLIFLFFFGGYSCLSPFLSVYFSSIGLPSDQIGILQALRPFTSFVGSPIVTYVADKTGKHGTILIATLTISVLARFFTMFLGNNLWILIFATIFIEFFNGPTGSLINNSVLDTLGDRRMDYGKQRLWGAVGWGSFSLLIGAIVTETHNIYYTFWSFLIVMIGTIGVAFMLKHPTSKLEEEKSDQHKQPAVVRVFRLMTSSFESFMLYIIAFIMGTASGIHFTYLFLFLQSLGGTELLMGLSLTVTCVAELPFFFWSEILLRRFGPRGVMYLSLFCYALRLLYYSFLTNPWAVLPAELLHGVTFGAYWSASISLASSTAPPSLSATAQGLLSGFYEGLGTGAGTLLGGFIYQNYGPQAMYFATSLALFGCLFIFLAYQAIRKVFGPKVDHVILQEEEPKYEQVELNEPEEQENNPNSTFVIE